MSRKKYILFGVGILIAVLLIAVFFIFFYSSNPAAQLFVESPTILLNENTAQGNLKLKESDKVEALEDGSANIILYESVVIKIGEGTSIVVTDLQKENPKVSQSGGVAWYTFTKLFGVENFEASTSNSTASVRGTSFQLKDDKILVADGSVNYISNGNPLNVGKGQVGEKGVVRGLTQSEKADIKVQLMSSVDSLVNLRKKVIEDNPLVVKIATSIINTETNTEYEGTDSEIERAFAAVDSGDISIEEIESKVPTSIKPINKILQITKEIIRLKALILEYS